MLTVGDKKGEDAEGKVKKGGRGGDGLAMDAYF